MDSGILFGAHNLTVESGDLKIVKNATIALKSGETAAIIGESGSGKTTLILAAAGLLPKTLRISSGSARINGRAGFVMQNPSSCFDPVFTIENHFKETLAAAGMKDRVSREYFGGLAAETGLVWEEVRRAYSFQLSGGMLQRLMIALALATEPDILVADEPATDLDSPGRNEILDLICRVREERKPALLFVTHDLALAARMGGTIYVMKSGSVVESGAASDILGRPVHPYTRALAEANMKNYLTPWGDLRNRRERGFSA